jgi:excisionase family DNA binding protein
MENNAAVPMLFPYEPSEFWAQIRQIVHEELVQTKNANLSDSNLMVTPGLTEKPLYKIAEICKLFDVSRTTVHDWVKHGKLRKVKVRSRVYFLGTDIKQLMEP